MTGSDATGPSTPSTSDGATLHRGLGLFLLTCYGLGTIVGAGIYVLIGAVAGRAGLAAPWSFVIAGAVAMLTGLAYAEFSARYPEAGGEAVFVQEGFGSGLVSRLVGLTAGLVGLIAAAAIARGSAGYILLFVSIPEAVAAGAVVVLFTAIACFGVVQSVTLAAVITVIEMGGLAAVVLAGASGFATLPDRAIELIPHWPDGIEAMIGGAVIAFFAYSGFETMIYMAEETRDPRRTIPRAILLAIALAGLFYALVAMASVLTVGPVRLAESNAPLALVVGEALGAGASVLAALAVVATVNGVLVQVLMGSRLIYGMARRGWLPAWLAAVWPRTRTPVRATLLAGAIALGLAVSAPVKTLAVGASLVLLVLFCVINLALWAVRRRVAAPAGILRTPSWLPLLAAALSLALIVANFLP